MTIKLLHQPDMTDIVRQMDSLQRAIGGAFSMPPGYTEAAIDRKLGLYVTPKRRGKPPLVEPEIGYRYTPANVPLGGLRIIENDLLTIGPFEDWSQVRSPGRARRRRKLGHPQRITYFHKPDPELKVMGDTIIGHPVTIAALLRSFGDQVAADRNKAALNVLLGRNPL